MNHTSTPELTSVLGIDYVEVIPAHLVSLFIQAEHEWLQNANECYDVDAWEVWAGDILPRIATHTLQAVDIDDIRRYLPIFLEQVTGIPDPESLSDTAIQNAITSFLTSA